ncbi:MAG TPA: tetratricopeptide repeat protein, partial [Anaerolineales bacterium]
MAGFEVFPGGRFSLFGDNEMKLHAERGDHKAQFLIGFSYLTGEYRDGSPVEKNHEKALKWIRLSAEGGYSYAQFHIGGMYQQGIGVAKDDVLAAKWFLEAAKTGNIKARTNIAGLYYEGTGIKQDFEKAYAWASLAAYKGNENAKTLVQLIVPKLKNRKKADLLAGEYFKKYGSGGSEEKTINGLTSRIWTPPASTVLMI